jgi:hypothetical protein
MGRGHGQNHYYQGDYFIEHPYPAYEIPYYGSGGSATSGVPPVDNS